MAEKLEWGFTDAVEQSWRTNEPYVKATLGAAVSSIDRLTVNGVPLADVLERVADLVDELGHLHFPEQTTAAALRALAGRDSDET